jgi:hypothetical protein
VRQRPEPASPIHSLALRCLRTRGRGHRMHRPTPITLERCRSRRLVRRSREPLGRDGRNQDRRVLVPAPRRAPIATVSQSACRCGTHRPTALRERIGPRPATRLGCSREVGEERILTKTKRRSTAEVPRRHFTPPGTGTDAEFACLHEFAVLNPQFGVHFPRDRPHMEPPSPRRIAKIASVSRTDASSPCNSLRTISGIGT